MKRFLRNFGICVVAGLGGYLIASAFLSFMTPSKTEKGYIGPSEIKIEDGVMTPETLLAFGRISDPQVSPDGQKVLYGVSYTDIAKNRSCRNRTKYYRTKIRQSSF